MNTGIPEMMEENREWRFKPTWDLGSKGPREDEELVMITLLWHIVAWRGMADVLGPAALSLTVWSKASILLLVWATSGGPALERLTLLTWYM